MKLNKSYGLECSGLRGMKRRSSRMMWQQDRAEEQRDEEWTNMAPLGLWCEQAEERQRLFNPDSVRLSRYSLVLLSSCRLFIIPSSGL